MKRSSSLAALALAGFLLSCNSDDLPTAPNLQPVLLAYENPTAIVGSAIMSAVADGIAESADAIENSEIFAEILEVIAEVQRELDENTNENGDLVLDATCDGGTNDGNGCASDDDCPGGTCGGGVAFPTPTGAIQASFICPGWNDRQFDPNYDAEPDPTNGAVDLTMTLDSLGIGRVVWGSADKCLYLVPGEGRNFQASYDGSIALDLGDPVPLDGDIDQLPVTFVLEGNIGFDGEDFRINQSFRIVLADETGLEILVDLGDPALSETFNYIFQGRAQALTDATGTFGCSLEESRCFDESGILFSW